MHSSARIAWNALMSWTSSLLSMAAAFFLIGYLVGELGKEAYGLVGLVESLILFTLLADLGVRDATSRHLQVAIAQQDTAYANQLFSSALAASSLLAGLLALVLALAAGPLVRFSHVPPELQATGVFLVRYYAGAAIALAFVYPTYAAVLESCRRFDLAYVCHMFEVVLRVAATVLMVGHWRWGLQGWAIALLVAKVACVVLCITLAHRTWRPLELRPAHVHRKAFGELFSLGGQLMVLRSVSALGVQTDPFVLSRFLGPGAVTLYQPSQRIISAAQQFTLALNTQLKQMAATYYGQGNQAALVKLLLTGTRFSFLMGIGSAVILSVFAYPLLNVWLGPKLGDDTRYAAWTLVVWVLVDLFQQAGGSQYQVLLGLNRIRYVVWLQAGLAAVNLVLSLMLVGYLTHRGWGMRAVPFVVVPTAVMSALQRVLITVHVARAVQLPLLQYLRTSYARPLMVLAVSALGGYAVLRVVQPQNFLSLGLAVGLSSAIWLAACWALAFEAEDKARFAGIFRAVREKLAG